MHRILYITDSADSLTNKVKTVAEGQLDIETVSGAAVPSSLASYDALLVGDTALANPLSDTGDNGPKLVQLTRGHHKDVDTAALIASGITVTGSSPVLAPYVARHVLGLAKAASGDSNQAPEGGNGSDHQGPSMAGKTVGVVGFGRIGMAVTDLYKLLGATVIYCDVRTAPHGSAEAAGVRRSTLDLLLSKSDIVSLHVQWGPTSNPLLSERELRLMGRESILVNTADARLIDNEALATALSSGRMKAALDVEDTSNPALANTLATASTPYVAARSEEADENVAEFVVKNILTALSGSEPDGVIEIIDYPRLGDPAFWSSKMSPREV